VIHRVCAVLLLTCTGRSSVATPPSSVSPEQIERAILDKQDEGTPEGRERREEEQFLKKLRETVRSDNMGEVLPKAPASRVSEILKEPSLFAEQYVKITGLIRQCSKEGAWLELADLPSDPSGIRVLPPQGWRFEGGEGARRVTAFGQLVKRALDAKAAQALDVEAGFKPRKRARTEWVLLSTGVEVVWLP
jgi:hypothetical protein